MPASTRNFWITLIVGWIALAAAAVVYARMKFIPPSLAVPIVAAFLAEYSFYLVPGFESVRVWIEARLSGWRLPAVLTFAGILPYLIYSPLTAQFHWLPLVRLTLLAAAIAFWYEIRRPSPTADAAYLVILAAPALSGFFDAIYTSPLLKVDLEVFGRLMTIRVAASMVLARRKPSGLGFGFWPTWREWKIGAAYFAAFLPVGLPLALGVGLYRFRPDAGAIWKVLPLLIGMLWVVAFSEEFFFRGLLQHWIEKWTHSSCAALIAASVLFGASHLGYRAFPNWRFALLAAVAGLFYGHAYKTGAGIRAAMVAHALTNVTVKSLFA